MVVFELKKKYELVPMFVHFLLLICRYVPRSSQLKTHSSTHPSKVVEVERRLDDLDVKDSSPPDWNNLENYHHKIAQIIQYETSADVHFPGTSEYKRRRVRNGTCNSIYPDMIVVPKFESDISRILQISNIVGVPVSVRSEGRSYNLCQSVKPSKYTIRPNELLNKEPLSLFYSPLYDSII